MKTVGISWALIVISLSMLNGGSAFGEDSYSKEFDQLMRLAIGPQYNAPDTKHSTLTVPPQAPGLGPVQLVAAELVETQVEYVESDPMSRRVRPLKVVPVVVAQAVEPVPVELAAAESRHLQQAGETQYTPEIDVVQHNEIESYDDSASYSDRRHIRHVWNHGVNNCCASGLFFGAESTFLTAIDEPIQSVTLTDLVTNDTYTSTTDPGFGAGVRTWLGIQQPSGWGFRSIYWYYELNDTDLDPTVPNAAEPASLSNSYIQAQTLDVEVTQSFCFWGGKVFTSVGGRYARLKRNHSLNAYGDVNDVSLYGLAVGANEVDATGTTFSIGRIKPLFGSCHWNSFFGYRGSWLRGDVEASALTDANAVGKPPVGAGSAYSRDTASVSDKCDDIFISEIQAGLQYQRPICCSCAILFARGGFEYQHWGLDHVTASSNSFAFIQGAAPDFGGRVDAGADAFDDDLSLIGLFLGGGITY